MNTTSTTDTAVVTNSPRAWVLAARPKTLAGAAVPVIIGTAFAFRDAGSDYFQIVPAILCFLFAFIMQIDANFVNDYFDFKHGNDDTSTRLGPKRACSEGWITPSAMVRGIAVTTAVACVVGFPLVFYGGLEMILIGAACVLFCFLYTTRLSYLGWGDILVLVFFGIIPVTLTYYLETPIGMAKTTLGVVVASVACGLVIDTLLIVNNYRDRDNDRRDHKLTLVVRMGARRAEQLYLALGYIAAGLMAAVVASMGAALTRPYAYLALVVYLIFHTNTYRRMKQIAAGRELNAILGLTARNIFFYGVLCACAIGLA